MSHSITVTTAMFPRMQWAPGTGHCGVV